MSNLQIKPIKDDADARECDVVRFDYNGGYERVGVIGSDISGQLYLTELDPSLGNTWKFPSLKINIIEVIRNSEITFTVE